MKAISPLESPNGSAPTAPLLEPRAGAVFALAALVAGVTGLLIHFGLVYDTAELIPLLENGTALNLLAGLGLTGLAASHILVYRHFLLLLNFVRTLRTVFLRYLRHLLPAAPALCSTPRTAHGCRAPPLAI
ncbi:hypothetical protein [Microbulbifer halophilus]|uniref:Uncharacterized protein n=1 Tax=Microbulbifer halophilus TaxID=453963 RepID=A0ABW5EGG5_9GAMM|nr:hypothetical protein [Microbulbifer halophilus]MCW8128454.1 hypothetical protein [Microbulbifer halophilus]